MASVKKSKNINEVMTILDKNPLDNTGNESEEPLILDKEYNSELLSKLRQEEKLPIDTESIIAEAEKTLATEKKLNHIKEIITDSNLKKDFKNVKNQTLKINDVIKEHEKRLKSLYEKKDEFDLDIINFQKNKNQLQFDFINKQQEAIKKYEEEARKLKNENQLLVESNNIKLELIQKNNKEITNLQEVYNNLKIAENELKELKNLNQEYSKKIVSLEKLNTDLKNKEEEVKHYQNDNLRLSNKLFEAIKKLDDIKTKINNFENNKSQIQEQINNLNKIISKNNIVKDQFNQFNNNKDDQKISMISKNKKPNPKLEISENELKEKDKTLTDIDSKIKEIFIN